MKTNTVATSNSRLFAGERMLVFVSLIGFLLAVICAVYMGMNGSIILPEGNIESAFSFNAAIGIYTLSIAAILPLAGLTNKKRAKIRWGFFWTALLSYGIETVQHFRGINPRFTRAGSILDSAIGGFFGLISLIIIILTVLLTIAFFRRTLMKNRPLFIIGIRYAFLSIMLAFAAGIVMIILQGRYTGAAGNFIVLHGLGFHALQTLPLLGWLCERVKLDGKQTFKYLHLGSLSWLISISLIGFQTVIGQTIFEFTIIPIAAASFMLVSLTIIVVMLIRVPKLYLKNKLQPLFKMD